MGLKMLAPIWAAIILLLTLTPAEGEPYIEIPHIDKVVHCGIFFIFWYFTYIGWKPIQGVLKWVLVITPGIVLAGVSEFLQAFVPGRNPDLYDFSFNLIGIFLGIIVTKRIIIHYKDVN